MVVSVTVLSADDCVSAVDKTVLLLVVDVVWIGLPLVEAYAVPEGGALVFE